MKSEELRVKSYGVAQGATIVEENIGISDDLPNELLMEARR
jgi:hypothetical protein